MAGNAGYVALYKSHKLTFRASFAMGIATLIGIGVMVGVGVGVLVTVGVGVGVLVMVGVGVGVLVGVGVGVGVKVGALVGVGVGVGVMVGVLVGVGVIVGVGVGVGVGVHGILTITGTLRASGVSSSANTPMRYCCSLNIFCKALLIEEFVTTSFCPIKFSKSLFIICSPHLK